MVLFMVGYYSENHTSVATWCDWLMMNDPQVPTVAIAGNLQKWWSGPFPDNDGLILVDQAHLDYARFNPTIYATHCRKWTNYDEWALTTCTYVTEFIKKWIIDDEELSEASITSPDAVSMYPNPWPQISENNIQYEGSIRAKVYVDSYEKILSFVSFFTEETGPYGVPLHKCINSLPGKAGDPVILENPGYLDIGYHILKYYINDMVHGEIACGEKCFIRYPIQPTWDGSKILVLEPENVQLLGNSSTWIKWASDELYLSTEIYFSADGGATYIKIYEKGPNSFPWGLGIYKDSIQWITPQISSN